MLIVGGNQSAAGGYDVANSLRFNDGSSDSLNRTPSTASDRRTFTVSFWAKKTKEGGEDKIFGAAPSGVNNPTYIMFGDNVSNALTVAQYTGSHTFRLTTTQLFRDPSAWYHIVVAFDTTQATSSNRIKIYVNGNQVTDFQTSSYPSLNLQTDVNNTSYHQIGITGGASTGFFDGYLCEFVLIDGQQLDPTSFGEFDEDSGVWKPIDVSGLTFGTNGFYLPFENSAALGQDDSGNGNNFTVNNLTSIDQSTDTCTNNYSTMSPIIPSYSGGGISPATFSEGNLNVSGSSTYWYAFGGFQVSQGKWYWEGKVISISGSYEGTGFGFQDMENLYNPSASYPSNNIYVYGNDGDTRDPTNGATSYGSSYTTNDIIGIAMDLDNGYGYFSKNGVWQNSGDPESGASGTGAAFSLNPAATGQFFAPFVADDSTTTSSVQFSLNFGSPAFSISSGNSDGAGYGNFEYAVPSGYYALNTKNLAEYG